MADYSKLKKAELVEELEARDVTIVRLEEKVEEAHKATALALEAPAAVEAVNFDSKKLVTALRPFAQSQTLTAADIGRMREAEAVTVRVTVADLRRAVETIKEFEA